MYLNVELVLSILRSEAYTLLLPQEENKNTSFHTYQKSNRNESFFYTKANLLCLPSTDTANDISK